MNSRLLSYKLEIYRKLFHLTSLIIPLILCYLDYLQSSLFITFSFTIILFIDIGRRHLSIINSFYNYILKFVTRKYELNDFLSATYMLLSFLIITLLFNKNIIIAAMILSIISDTTAALFGMKYGKIILFNNKTLEGSYIFFSTSYILLYFSYLDLTQVNIVIISFIATMVELLTPTKYDNFTIPIITSIIIYILL